VKEHEIEEDNKGDLEETLEEIVVKADEGDMLFLEWTWNDPKEDKDEQRFHSNSMFLSKLFSLIIPKGNHAHDVPLSKVNLPTPTYDYSELHKWQKGL